MQHEINVNWQGKMAFDADVMGHHILMDSSAEVGGENKGARPKPLMLVALAGCTGMDVISILAKMKVVPEKFNIKVLGVTADEHPMKYLEMTVIYEFWGSDLPLDKLEKAVKLSEEKYCGVNALYKEVVKMKYEIVVNP